MDSSLFHNRQTSPLQDDAVRARLQEAILAGDSELFREILLGVSPELAKEHRLYSVLVMTADKGMLEVTVDEAGNRISDSNYVIKAGTPIEMLNAHFGESGMTVTLDGQTWTAPYPEKKNPQ